MIAAFDKIGLAKKGRSTVRVLSFLLVLVCLSHSFLPEHLDSFNVEIIELAENSENSKEKDTSKEENKSNEAEKFELPHQHTFASLGVRNTNCILKIEELASLSCDVLTPPPKSI